MPEYEIIVEALHREVYLPVEAASEEEARAMFERGDVTAVRFTEAIEVQGFESVREVAS